MRAAIGYIRVSTAKQGRSGLGLEAQQEALRRFAEAEGYTFADTFTEVESGKDDADHRSELAKVLDRAAKERAPIIVAEARSAEPRRAFHQRPDEASRAVYRDRARV